MVSLFGESCSDRMLLGRAGGTWASFSDKYLSQAGEDSDSGNQTPWIKLKMYSFEIEYMKYNMYRILKLNRYRFGKKQIIAIVFNGEISINLTTELCFKMFWMKVEISVSVFQNMQDILDEMSTSTIL